MTLTLTGWMLYGMWLVFGLMGLDFLAGLYRSLKAAELPHMLITGYLKDMLYYVIPLFLVANLASLWPLSVLMQIAYYIGVVGVALKYVVDIKNKI